MFGGRAHDGFLDACIGHAAAEIAVHMRDDFVLGRVGIFRQQRGCLHDLAGLAVAALRDLLGDPRLLQRMLALGVRPSMVVIFLPEASLTASGRTAPLRR